MAHAGAAMALHRYTLAFCQRVSCPKPDTDRSQVFASCWAYAVFNEPLQQHLSLVRRHC